jgi:hypothetical protein
MAGKKKVGGKSEGQMQHAEAIAAAMRARGYAESKQDLYRGGVRGRTFRDYMANARRLDHVARLAGFEGCAPRRPS